MKITCHASLPTDADYKTLRFEAGDLDLSLSLLLSSLFVSYHHDGDVGTYSCFLLLSLSPLLSRSLRSLSPRSERSLSLLSPRSRSSYLLLLLLFISSCPTRRLPPNHRQTMPPDGGGLTATHLSYLSSCLCLLSSLSILTSSTNSPASLLTLSPCPTTGISSAGGI
jgi:hypothetical protein